MTLKTAPAGGYAIGVIAGTRLTVPVPPKLLVVAIFGSMIASVVPQFARILDQEVGSDATDPRRA